MRCAIASDIGRSADTGISRSNCCTASRTGAVTADGVRRALSNNADVLVGGRRRPLVGTISMDNLTVDLGPDPDVGAGAPAVLIGVDGGERLTAEEMASRLGTINYEIGCGLTARVPRVYHRDGQPA